MATAATNQISSGVNRTAHLVNTMSDALMQALNTTNKLSSIDRKFVLGGRLANISAAFLNTTSNAVSMILRTKFIAVNTVIIRRTHITSSMLRISSNFINRTNHQIAKLLKLPFVIHSSVPSSGIARKLLNTTINLVNSTSQSLANVINASSVFLTKSHDDQSNFATQLLNSTAHLISATTESLENLLNKTNHLIADIVQSKANASIAVLDGTINVLDASCSSVSSFLNLTTLLLSNAATEKLTGNGHNITITALNLAHEAIKIVLHKTSNLVQGVIITETDVLLRLINTTRAYLDATIKIKAALLNATVDAINMITNPTMNSTTHKIPTQTLTDETHENQTHVTNEINGENEESEITSSTISTTSNEIPYSNTMVDSEPDKIQIATSNTTPSNQ